MPRNVQMRSGFVLLILLVLSSTACRQDEARLPLVVPRGYVQIIEIEQGDRLFTFGPFVGYYFRPATPNSLEHLHFVCFNERSFYTRDLPANTKLFEGEAILRNLEDVGFAVPSENRINPLVFAKAPQQWLVKRPKPHDGFVHFHSCYDAQGPVLAGYWFKHIGKARFVYDMGGRVDRQSVLFHEVSRGVDTSFAHLMEFDRGTSHY